MSRVLHRVVFALAFGMVCAAGVASSNAAPVTVGIVAVVNGDIISNYDLDQRIALFAFSSGNPVTAETLREIRLQVLTSLEDQMLELQEAGKHRIIVTNAEVDKAVQSIAEGKHLSVEQMVATVTSAGVSVTTFRADIAAGLIWRKVVTARYPEALPSDLDIDAATENYLQDLRRDANIVRR